MMRIYDKNTGWRDATREEWPKTLSMDKIITHNKTAGGHFFDKDTMRHWGSRVVSEEAQLHEPSDRYLFITSEKDYTGSGRSFSIRRYNPESGDVMTSWDFKGFSSAKAAQTILDQTIEGGNRTGHNASEDEVVEALAAEFSSIVNVWTTKKELKEINLRNHAEPDKNVCHSHDFIDANEAMAKAYFNVSGRELNPQDEEHTNRVNAAWDMAKGLGFTCHLEQEKTQEVTHGLGM